MQKHAYFFKIIALKTLKELYSYLMKWMVKLQNISIMQFTMILNNKLKKSLLG